VKRLACEAVADETDAEDVRHLKDLKEEPQMAAEGRRDNSNGCRLAAPAVEEYWLRSCGFCGLLRFPVHAREMMTAPDDKVRTRMSHVAAVTSPRAMAEAGARVTGIDISPRMIALAEGYEAEAPLGSPLLRVLRSHQAGCVTVGVERSLTLI
jgi:hypothetical protein